MRNRWIMAALVATAGLLASPAAERAHAQATGWDMSGNEESPLWAPVGTYQHDGSGIYTGIELVYLSQQRTLGNQTIAWRGFAQNFLGGWVGSREVALSSEELGRTTWGAGYRATLGYRMENGWNFSISWLHLFDVKYTGGAGPIGPNIFNPGELGANMFISSPVYNFSQDFAGHNPFPNPPFTVNITAGIWNAATDMTLVFTQRFDNWDLAGRFPVFETENARSYAIAGGRFSWIWERFQWRTVKPEVVFDGTNFVFDHSPESAARYLNTLSQRMYGPMVGVGHEVMLYSGQAGAFGIGTELTGALLLNIGKERAKYIREDESTQVKRAWWEQTLTPNINAQVNLTWQPFDGVQFRVGYNFLNYFNTKYMQEPVSFNAGALDPAYGTKFWRLIHGTNFGVAFTY
jgi:hypothetical protein